MSTDPSLTLRRRGEFVIGRLPGLVSAMATLLLAGCTQSAISVTPPSPSSSGVQDICSDLAEALPSTLLGLRKVKTNPQSPLTAAWSDSADGIITLRCGVPSVDSATGDILNVNDVDWIPVARTAGTSFTTFGRVAFVQVDVPISLRPEASFLVPLATAIVGAVPSTN